MKKKNDRQQGLSQTAKIGILAVIGLLILVNGILVGVYLSNQRVGILPTNTPSPYTNASTTPTIDPASENPIPFLPTATPRPSNDETPPTGHPTTSLEVGISMTDIVYEFVVDMQVDMQNMDTYPAVINYSATWCRPCRDMLPAVDDLYQANPDITIFSVMDRSTAAISIEDILELYEVYDIDLPIGYEVENQLTTQYRFPYFPATFFVDEAGIVQHIEYGRVSVQTLTDLMQEHLTIKQP